MQVPATADEPRDDPMEEEDLDVAFKIEGIDLTNPGASVPRFNEAQMEKVGDVLEKAAKNKTKPPGSTKIPRGDGTTKKVSIKSFKYAAEAEYRCTVKGRSYVPDGTKPNAFLARTMVKFGRDRKSMEPTGIINQMCQEYVGPELRRRMEILVERGVLETVHIVEDVVDEKLAPVKEAVAKNERAIGELTETVNGNHAQTEKKIGDLYQGVADKFKAQDEQLAFLENQMARLLAAHQSPLP